jgi:hypothetical protein
MLITTFGDFSWGYYLGSYIYIKTSGEILKFFFII